MLKQTVVIQMYTFTLCSVILTSISASVNICKTYRGATSASACDHNRNEYNHTKTVSANHTQQVTFFLSLDAVINCSKLANGKIL